MSDYGADWTEEQLAELESRIATEYQKAYNDLRQTVTDYFAAFEKRDEAQRALLDAGQITEDYYTQWRLAQIGRGERFTVLRDRMAQRMYTADKAAAAYINDATPGIYSLNRNYAAYTIEQVSGDVGFDLVDEQTVRRLVASQPDSMPFYPPERAVNRGLDLAWGKRQITAQVTQSILAGQSIKHMADRLQDSITGMSRTSAVRAARTAVTGAQNAGRVATYDAALKMGIKLKKQWFATLDGRTRHSHAALDGQSVANDKKFPNGCMFPGDPSGPPAEVYNCRCTLIADIEDSPYRNAQRRVGERGEVMPDMTYQEWATQKTEMLRRRIGQQGQEVIDKPTYNKLTREFRRRGGLIIRGEDAQTHLAASGAYASYISGVNVAFIRDDATVSDVLEEMYHAKQDWEKDFGAELTLETRLRREIEAQKYLINQAEKYKIPSDEREVTLLNLSQYESQLLRLLRGE